MVTLSFSRLQATAMVTMLTIVACTVTSGLLRCASTITASLTASAFTMVTTAGTSTVAIAVVVFVPS